MTFSANNNLTFIEKASITFIEKIHTGTLTIKRIQRGTGEPIQAIEIAPYRTAQAAVMKYL